MLSAKKKQLRFGMGCAVDGLIDCWWGRLEEERREGSGDGGTNRIQ